MTERVTHSAIVRPVASPHGQCVLRIAVSSQLSAQTDKDGPRALQGRELIVVSLPELARHVSLLLTVAVTEVKTAGQVDASERIDRQSVRSASVTGVQVNTVLNVHRNHKAY